MSAEAQEYGCFVAGEEVRTGDVREVKNPYGGAVLARVQRAGVEEIARAISTAAETFNQTRKLPSWKRSEILSRISQAIDRDREEFSRTIALEAGKPLKTARAEVDRAVFTFSVASEEARRIDGEIIPLDWISGGEGCTAHVHHVPLGPILGITPFNFPLNLVGHKVAPAIAAGNTIIIRPSSQTPLSSLKLARVAQESGLPDGALSVLPCSTDDASLLVDDERLRMLTFTGSPEVGWKLKEQAGRKRVTLELGGNAAVIVHSDADCALAAERVAWGGFYHAGQSCISVQRVYVHTDIYHSFRDLVVERVKGLKVGDPLDDSTDVGPVIDADAAERVEEWIQEALNAGGRALVGGGRDGLMVEPTVLEGVPEDAKASCREIFAPVVLLYPYEDVDDAIHRADNSDYGLQAGIFTNSMDVIQRAFDRIEVGGLMVNEVSAFRIDHMPYGGAKQSGLGREGLKYAIREMSEMKLLMVKRLPQE